MNPQLSRSRRGRFVPQVEALDERICPAVDYFRFGTTLLIRGTPLADQIETVDRGGGAIAVNSTGRFPASFRGIRQIVVNSLDGNDLVAHKFDGRLGTIPADYRCDVGAGDDDVSMRARDMNIRSAARPWGVTIDGDMGDEDVAVALGTVVGDVSIKIQLGDGDNQCVMQYKRTGELPAHRKLPGLTDVLVTGGSEVDEVTLNWAKSPAVSDLRFRAVLGADDDRFHCATGNVVRGVTVQTDALGEGGEDTFIIINRGKPTDAISRIDGALKQRVFGGPGADHATLTAIKCQASGEWSWGADLGDDDDIATVRLSDVTVSGVADFKNHLGAGDDGGFVKTTAVAVTGRMGWNIDLGAGENSFSWGMTGLEVMGTLVASIHGGDDSDLVGIPVEQFRIAAGALVQFGVHTGGARDMVNIALSTDVAEDARAAFMLDTGADDDAVFMSLNFTSESKGVWEASADGGDGFDIFRGTRDVEVTNFEHVSFFP